MKKVAKTPVLFLLLFCGVSPLLAQPPKEALILALHDDQKYRGQLQQLKQKPHKNLKLIKQLEAAQDELDAHNAATLQQVIQALGHWPGVSDVGDNPAKIALLLFKRSSIEQQASYLPLMLEQVQQQNLPPSWYTESYDHHLMQQDLPQRYGHLLIKSVADNSHTLYPLTSIEQANQDRAALNLPPLQMVLGAKNLLLREHFGRSEDFQVLPAGQLISMAALASTCLNQTYPNSIKHILNSSEDATPPDHLYPAFYGCFDWHSSVHGHWLLARASRLLPNHPKTATFMAQLDAHFTAEKLQAELQYFQQPGRAGFERPYGLAWLLQLYAELHAWDHPQAKQWLHNMTPLKDHIVGQLSSWIPKLAYPIRSGEHSQTAFAFGLALDYAEITGDQALQQLLIKHSKRLYLQDQKCPTDYEPSGHDFLSPCLAEADLMRRVMPAAKYAKWLKKFLPKIKQGSRWLPVATVTDRVDGKLAHLDGLNLARAWMLEGMAAGLPERDKRRQTLMRLAEQHAQSGLVAVTGEHYAGGHWLGSFATYYLTQRGIR